MEAILVILASSPESDRKWLQLAAKTVCARLLSGRVSVSFIEEGVLFTYSDEYVQSPECLVSVIDWATEVRKYAALHGQA